MVWCPSMSRRQPGAAFFYYPALDPYYRDDIENGQNDWTVFNFNDTEPFNWLITGIETFAGQNSWVAPGLTSPSDMSLVSPPIAITNQTELSFWHQYDLEESFDGGVVEISTNSNPLASGDMGPWMTANPYYGNIAAGTQSPLEGRPAFTGNSGGYVRTVIDLSQFANRTIIIRFRLTSDAANAGAGWWIDNVMVR